MSRVRRVALTMVTGPEVGGPYREVGGHVRYVIDHQATVVAKGGAKLELAHHDGNTELQGRRSTADGHRRTGAIAL